MRELLRAAPGGSASRRRRYDDALRVLSNLRRRYPRNRLVLLEAGGTALRANKPAEADALLTEGLRMFAADSRAKIPGEEALWHYKRGAARVLLRKREEALADLRLARAIAAGGEGPRTWKWAGSRCTGGAAGGENGGNAGRHDLRAEQRQICVEEQRIR